MVKESDYGYYRKSPMSERATAKKANVITGKCKESCIALRDDLGQMNALELDEWRNSLVEQREVSRDRRSELAATDFQTFGNEIACITKWQNECEPEYAVCKADCRQMREYPHLHMPVTLQEELTLLDTAENVTTPRTECIEAQRKLNCAQKFETECGEPVPLPSQEELAWTYPKVGEIKELKERRRR